jgi:hypothetical protein
MSVEPYHHVKFALEKPLASTACFSHIDKQQFSVFFSLFVLLNLVLVSVNSTHSSNR